MKKKKVLSICNTPLQIICAVVMKNTVYKNDLFYIVISDHIKNADNIVNNARKNSLFADTYKANTYNYTYGLEKKKKNKVLSLLLYNRDKRKKLAELFPCDEKFDILLFNNLDKFVQLVYSAQYKKNKKVKAYMYEDGYSSYLMQGVMWKKEMYSKKGKSHYIKRYLHRERFLYENISGQYVYSPELVKWEAPFERLAIPKLTLDSKEIIEELNLLFGYKNMEDNYNKPIIFFEESYRADGNDIGDVELLNIIADIVGKDKIMVKKHPRSDDAIFSNLGYKVNVNTEIPWELIVLNNPKMLDKTFVTVCSGAAATPFTMFNMPVRSVILLDILKDKIIEKVPNMFDVYFNYMNENVFDKYKEVFIKPQSIEEMKKLFEEIFNEE